MHDNRQQERSRTIGLVLISMLVSYLFLNFLSPAKKEDKKKDPTAWVDDVLQSTTSPKDIIQSTYLETEVQRYFFSTQGAQLARVEIKKHQNQTGAPLQLIHPGHSCISWELKDQKGHLFHTDDKPFVLDTTASNQQKMRFQYHEGEKDAIYITYRVQGNTLQATIDLGEAWPIQEAMSFTVYYDPQDQENYDKSGQTYISYYTKTWNYVENQKNGFFTDKSNDRKYGQIIQKAKWFTFHTPYMQCTYLPKKESRVRFGIEQCSEDFKKKHPNSLKKMAIRFTLPKGNSHTIGCYLGPNTIEALKKVEKYYPGKNLHRSYYYGKPFFNYINQWLLHPALNKLNQWVGNILLALFLLVLLLGILMAPLSYRAAVYQVQVEAAKPFLEAIRAKNQENARIEESHFQRNLGINPLRAVLVSICWLILFLCMVSILPYKIAFRHQSFLWIKDISCPDDFLKLPFGWKLWLIGGHISLLGLIAASVNQLISHLNRQQSVNQMPGTPGTQKILKYLFILMSIIFFNQRSAVLILYRLMYTIIEKTQTQLFKKWLPKEKIQQAIIEKARIVSMESTTTSSRAQSRLEKRMGRKK